MTPTENRFPSWHSYSTIFNLGHRAAGALKGVECLVQEKVDGSQFSFGVDLDGELHCRSKGAIINTHDPEGMFKLGVEAVKALQDKLIPGWTYRGEYLQKPKHSSYAYNRVPLNHVILFDINSGDEQFVPYCDVVIEAERLGLEVVPRLMIGVPTLEDIQGFLQLESILGGQKIEGVVLKPVNYDIYGTDKKVLMGKHVSEAFREVHKHEWTGSNPSQGDFVDLLAQAYRTPARWNKAIMRLREAGKIQDSPKDIGPIMAEVPVDVLKECAEEIKEALFKHFWPTIRRVTTAGFPEWYKDELLKAQFAEPEKIEMPMGLTAEDGAGPGE